MAADMSAQVYLVLRLALGLVFLGSALAKFRDPSAFSRGVLEYRVLPRPLALIYGRLLPFVELGTALLLLSGFAPVIGAGLAVLLLVSFGVAIVTVTVQGREIGCHCFGEAPHRQVGWHTMLRDLPLLAFACWLLVAAVAGRAHDLRLAPGVFVLALLLALSYALLLEGLDLLVSASVYRRDLAPHWERDEGRGRLIEE